MFKRFYLNKTDDGPPSSKVPKSILLFLT